MPPSDKSVSSSSFVLEVIKCASRLDDTLNKLCIAVEQLLASNKPSEMDPRRNFYKIFNQEADEYDKDFHKKYHDDLNTTLIFVSSIKPHLNLHIDTKAGRSVLYRCVCVYC